MKILHFTEINRGMLLLIDFEKVFDKFHHRQRNMCHSKKGAIQ